MSTDQKQLYCIPCGAHYLGPDKMPCPQCSMPMSASALEVEPSLGDFLSDVVDDVIAQFAETERPSLTDKLAYAQVLALVKIAYELERITP